MKHDYYHACKAEMNYQNTKAGKGIYNIFNAGFKFSFKTSVLFFLFLFIAGSVMAQGTYTWNGATSDFQVTTNWTPTRVSPNVGDILILQNINQTITNVPTQTIASITLQVSGEAAIITLQGALAGNVLTLSSPTNALVVNATCGLTIGANMAIALSGTSTDAGTITVANGGLLNFTGAGQTDPGNITVNAGGELRFSGSGAPVLHAPLITGGTLTIAGTVSAATGTAPIYASGDTLQYKVSTNISTGVELPASIDNLVISNVGSNNQVKLLSSVTVTGTSTGLNITNGILTLNGKMLTVTGLANGVNGLGRIFVDAAATIVFTGNNAGAIGTLYFVSTSLGTLIMNRTGAGAALTIGSVLKVSNTLTLNSGIINIADGFTLTYSGSAANLSAGSTTSYISFLNSSSINYGFRLGDAATSMNAATYTLPLGTTTTTGNPAVSGYRPVQITWSVAGANSFYIGLMNDTGVSASPGRATDVPLTGNNRAGYIASISTNVASYGFTMSYSNSDFTTTPVIGNVNFYNWNGSFWSKNCQSSNTPGALNYINQTGWTFTSGTLVLGEYGGTDLSASSPVYYWTGAVSNVWENPANWSGACGLYPGASSSHDTVYITASGAPHQPTLSSAISVWKVTISNANTLSLASTAYLTLYDITSPLGLSGGATVNANVLSTIEYADATYIGSFCAVFGPNSSCTHTNITTGFTYGNLVLSNRANPAQEGVQKNINASLAVANSLTVWGGVYAFITAGTTTVNGSVLLTSVLYSNVSYGGRIYNSSSTPLMMPCTYGTSTLNGSGNNFSENISYLNITGNLSVTGSTNITTLVIANGSTVSINAADTLMITGASGFSNSGILQSTASDGGTLYLNSPSGSFPVGKGSGGAFNGASGHRVSVILKSYTTYDQFGVVINPGGDTLDANAAINNLTVLIVNSNIGSLFALKSAKTLTVNGAFSNSTIIYGPGAIQFNGFVSIPVGNGSGGIFSNTSGTLLNLTVGDGTTSNTVSMTTVNSLTNLTVNTGGTFAINSSLSLSIAGNLTGAGAAMYGSADTIILNGSAVQNISTSTNFPLPALTVNNAGIAPINFVTLLSDITVNGTLTLTNGNINGNTNNHKVVMPSTGTGTVISNPNAGWIFGSLEKYFAPGSSVSKTFELGDSLAPCLIPTSATFASISGGGDLIVSYHPVKHPQLAASRINKDTCVARYWTVVNNPAVPISFTNANLSLSFTSAAVIPNSGTSTCGWISEVYNNSSWLLLPSTLTAQQATMSNLTSFGDYACGLSLDSVAGPSVNITPSAPSVCYGSTITFTATAAGSNLTYQWSKNGTAISGATATTYTTPFLTTGDNGSIYKVTVTATVTGCSAFATAPIVVNTAPVATITAGGPTNICSGSSVLLSVNTGTGFSYQWQLNGGNISGATATSYSASSAGSYSCLVTNNCGSSTSNVITITVTSSVPTATITAGGSTTICQGTSVTLNANTGTGLTYQWQLNAGNISGATLSSYAASAAGNYTCIVSNGCGSAISNTITVTVTTGSPPTATITAGGSTAICSGTYVVLSANTGTGLTYQWQLNGTNISGATLSSYSAGIAGSNTCIVSNNCGSTTSNAITITVISATASSNSPVCTGNTLALSASSGTTYSWTGPNGFTSTQQNPSVSNVTAANAGTYSVSFGNGCAIATTTVSITPTPTINTISNQTLCNGSLTAAVNFSGTGTGTVYNWTNSSTSIGLAASGTGNIASFTATNSGTSPVTATLTATPVTSGGFAYIANFVSNSVYVINTASNTNIASIAVGSNPYGISVSPDGSRVYVTNEGSNTVSVINTATNTVIATISVGSNPEWVCVSPDGSRVYVANTNSYSISVISTATNTVVSTISVGIISIGISISPDGNTLYVANFSSNTVTVINTNTSTITATISVGSYPEGISVSPDGSKVYVANSSSNTVSVINTVANTIVATIPVGSTPYGISVSPDGSKVYVANSNSNTLSVINTVSNSVTATITVGNIPEGVSISPDGSTVYVTNYSSNTVSVINAANNTITATIAAGGNPYSVGNFVTGTNCSGTPTSFNIAVNPSPSASSNSPVCTGNTLNLSASGGTTYSWTGPNGFTSTQQNPSITNVTTANAGTYSVTTGNGCGSAGINVIINQTPTINPVANQTLCNGSLTTAVNFSGTGTVYNWTNSSTAIGLAASGTGNIASFLATNSSASPITATIMATPVIPGFAYIANEGLNNVSVINTSTNAVIATIPVGSSPYGISVSSDGSRVYVTNESSNSVSVINTVTNTVISTITVGNSPEGISVSPDGSRVYVANSGSNTVSVINALTNTITYTIPVSIEPSGVAVSPDGSQLYIGNIGDNTVWHINASTNTVIASIQVAWNPQGLSVSPNGNTVYAAGESQNLVSVINTTTNTLTTTIPVGDYPFGTSISPDGSKVYVTNYYSNSVSVINTATNSVTATIAVGYEPIGISVSPDGSKVYVSNEGSNSVSVINTTTNAVIGTIQVGTYPFSLGNFVSGNNCSGTPATFNITVNPSPAASSNSPVCTGNTLNLSASGGTSYSWTGPNGFTSTQQNPNIPNVTTANAGTYSVTTTNGCGSAGINVIVNQTPTINPIGNQTLCNGSSTAAVNFSGTGTGTVYNWTNSSTAIGLAASGSGNIPSFTASNSNGTSLTGTITVTPASPAFAYIANSGSNTVSVVNTASNTITATIPVGSYPEGISVSPDGSTVYVANEASNNVSVINTSSNTVTATISVGSYPYGISVSPDGSRVYVANENSNTVSVINTSTNSVTATITVGSYPFGISVSPDGSRVYVANESSNTVSIINTTTNTVTATVAVGSGLIGISVSPDGSKVYITNYYSYTVSVINTSTNTVSATISVGNNPWGISVSPDGSKVYVANSSSNTVSVISTATNTVTASVAVGSSPRGISVSPDGSRVYVTNSGSNNVSVINTATNTVTATIIVGSSPYSFGNFVTGTNCSGTPTTFNITVSPAPTASSNSPVCTGNTLTLSSSGDSAYSWTGPNGFTSLLQNPSITNVTAANAGTYSVTGTDGCGSVTNVTINQIPTINPVANQTLCSGSSTAAVNFSGTGTGYNWTNSSTSIGLAASGTGNINSFIATNSSASPVTATITATPITPGFAYIANSGSNTVSVINTGTNAITATITVGSNPIGISLSPDGSKIYVANDGSNTVSVINTATNAVTATISVGNFPYGISVSPDGSKVYVTNSSSNSVSVISTFTNTVTATITVGSHPLGVSVSPDGSRVYVANELSYTTSVINTATNTVTATLSVGTYPWGISVSPDGSKVYVANEGSSTVSIINTATNTVTVSIAVGSNPIGISVSPDGSKVYVSNDGSNTVSVINTATNIVTSSILVGSGPIGISVSPDGSRVYAANVSSNNVSVINTATNTVIASIAVGGSPYSLGNFVTGSNCSGTPATFTITVNPLPIPTASSNSPTCTGSTLNLSSGGGISYSWTGPAGFTSTQQNPSLNNFTAANAGTYSVSVTGSNGCSATATTAVLVNPAPSATISANGGQSFICSGSSVTLNANTGTGLTYQWQLNGANISGATLSSYSASAAGNYTCIVTNSCSSTTSNTITITVVYTLPTATITAGGSTTFCSGSSVLLSANTGTGLRYQWQLNGSTISGATASSYSASAAGSYSCMVTNACGNTTSNSIIVSLYPLTLATASNNGPLCSGNTLNLSSGGGTSYSWMGPNGFSSMQQNTIITNAVSVNGGIYTVTVTDANGCTASASTAVTIYPVPSSGSGAQFIYTDNNISGANTVSAFSVGSNGALTAISGSPFSTGGNGNGSGGYYASNRIRSIQISGRLYVANDGGNSISAFNVNPVTGALTAVTGSPFTTGGTSSSGISLAATPNGNYLFAGNSGSNNISAFSINTDGSLNVISGSPFACGNSPDGMMVSPNGSFLALAFPNSSQVAILTIASNGSLTTPVLYSVSGEAAGIVFNSTGSLLFASNASTAGTTINVFSASSLGVLTVAAGSPFNFNNGGNNSNVAVLSSDDKFLFVSNQSSNSVSVFSVSNAGFLTQVSGSPFTGVGGTGPSGMAITNDNSHLYIASFSSIGAFNIQSNGSLSVIAGFPITLSGVSGLESIAIFQGNSLLASNNSPVCSGSTLNLSASGGASYSWTGPNGFSSTIQNPVITNVIMAYTGTYNVIVSNSNGCSATATTTVTVNALPVATSSSNSPVCSGGTLNLTSNGGISYLWTGPNSFTSTQQNPNITNVSTANSGTYSVTVTNICGSSTASSIVTVNSIPVGSASSNSPICSGSALNLLSSGGTDYSWAGPNGFTSTQQNPGIANATSINAGIYTVTITNASGCTANASTTVAIDAQPPTPTASSNSPLCSGNTLNLSSGGGTSYSWTGPNGFTSTLQNQVITNVTTGNTGTYTVTVTNGCGSASATAAVTVNSLPTAIASSNSPVCSGNALNLSSGGGTSYSWTGPNSFTSTLQNPGIANVTSLNAGTYTVIVTNSNSCTASASATVSVNTSPVATASSNSPVYTGGTLNLFSSGGVTYSWTGPNSFTSTQQNPSIANFASSNAGTYSVTVTNACGSASTTTIVTLNTSMTGTWTQLKTNSPHNNFGVMLLLSDGRVFCHTDAAYSDGYTGDIYDILTPDIHGSYVNGSWSTSAEGLDWRYSFSSQVLKDSRVYVAGGEYGTDGTQAGSHADVYDPVSNTWSALSTPGNIISDGDCQMLEDGRVLQAEVYDFTNLRHTAIFDPVSNSFSAGPDCQGIHNEAMWLKLPDNSILFVDMPRQNSCYCYTTPFTSERYIPASNTWIVDANVPDSLYDPYGYETGPAVMLPDGRAWFMGSGGHTAFYTPSGNTSPGTWTVGPNIPNGNGMPDAPLSMMMNGRILFACSPAPTSADNYPTPTYWYEFDYLTNTYYQVNAPQGGLSYNDVSQDNDLLNLPDGSILYANVFSPTYSVYTPGGGPIAAGKPTISTVRQIQDSLFTISGTLFNGISEGSAYGDENQDNTNYPLVRLTSGSGVYYARTANWNSTGVQRGSAMDSTHFILPLGLPATTYSLVVIANGIPSDPVTFNPFYAITTSVSGNSFCAGSSLNVSYIVSNALTAGNVFTAQLSDASGSFVSPVSIGTLNSTTSSNISCTIPVGTPYGTGYRIRVVSSNPVITGNDNGSNITIFNTIATASSNSPVCLGSALNLSSSGGGTSYSWSGPNGFTSILQNPVLSNFITADTGIYSVTITNTCGNTSSSTSVSATPLPTAIISASGSTSICSGSSVSLSANVGSGLSYQWQLNGSNISGATGSVYSAITSGNFTCNVYSALCSSISNSITVIVNPLPTPAVSGTLAFCSGSSTILSTGSFSSYLWSNGATSQSITVSIGGIFNVTVTDGNGCTGTSSSVTTIVNSIPMPAINGSLTFCQGGSTTLSTGSFSSYQWSTGSTSQSINVSTTGTYTVTVTNACGSASASATVSVSQLPTAIISANGSTVICSGSSASLRANTGTGLSYQWQLNGANISGAMSSDYSATAVGNYSCIVSNSCGSAVSNLITVSILATNATLVLQPNATTGVDAYISNYPPDINSNFGTIPDFDAQAWTNGGTSLVVRSLIRFDLSSIPTNAMVQQAIFTLYNNPTSGNAGGQHSNLSGTDASWLQKVTSSWNENTITWNNQPPTTTTNEVTVPQSTSPNEDYNLDVTILVQDMVNNPATNYGMMLRLQTESYYRALIFASSDNADSTKWPKLSVMYGTVQIIAGGSTTFCQGGSVTLNALPTGTGYAYQWQLNGTNISEATASSYSANAAGSYICVVSNGSCNVISNAVIVIVDSQPTASITAAGSTTLCSGGSVTLNANTGTGLNYQWLLSGVNISGATTSSYSVVAAGNYTCVVSNGCGSATSNQITISDFLSDSMLVLQPNAATGVDAYISNYPPDINSNFGTIPDFDAQAWTNGGTSLVVRSLIRFDLSSIPTNAMVQQAIFTLYNNPTSGNAGGQHSNLSGTDASWLQKVTSSWNENTITWNNQPPTTTTNEVTVPQSTSPNEDYNLDVTSLVQEMVNNPATNYGMMLRLQTESYYRALIFASSDNADSTKWPKLSVTYSSVQITAGGSTTFCQGGGITLSLTPVVAGYSYQWQLNGVNISNAIATTYSATVAGNYTCVVSSGNCNATSGVITLSVNPSPTATASSNSPICSGSTLNLASSGGISYSWIGPNSFSSTLQNSAINNASLTATGTYTLTVTNANGCTASATTIVTVSQPTPVINGSLTICAGSYTTLSAGAYSNYLWSSNATTQSINVSTVGSFSVTVTDGNGCIGTSSAVTTSINTCNVALNLKMFIEGYYKGDGLMQPVLYNEGIDPNPGSTYVDTITVCLVDSDLVVNDPYNMNYTGFGKLTPYTGFWINDTVATTKGLLQTNGSLSVTIGSVPAFKQYYLAIKQRGIVSTWSAHPISIYDGRSYDFTANKDSAYGSNQCDDFGEGIWSFYSGDWNQDENVDAADFPPYDYDLSDFRYGYWGTDWVFYVPSYDPSMGFLNESDDLNGDGNVDIYDYRIYDLNLSGFIYSKHP